MVIGESFAQQRVSPPTINSPALSADLCLETAIAHVKKNHIKTNKLEIF
jgi:hypothetical protein